MRTCLNPLAPIGNRCGGGLCLQTCDTPVGDAPETLNLVRLRLQTEVSGVSDAAHTS
jgi:hypothetical protein